MLGAVLAGGESRRFGSDKARALLGGKSLVERAAETLAAVFSEVVVVSSRPVSTPAWPQVPDALGGGGPLAGIAGALTYASSRGLEGAFVLACDLPLVEAGTVRSVLAALGEHPAAAPVAEGSVHWEPLCAVYRVACLPRVSEALRRDELAAHAVLDAVVAVPVPLPVASFLNVNTPADHVRAVSVLQTRAG